MEDTDRGSFRPAWIVVAIVTCVVFGSTVNQCLTCARAPEANLAVFDVEGEPFLAPEEEGPSQPPIDIVPKPPPLPTDSAFKVERPPGLEDHEDLTFDKIAGYQYEVKSAEEAAEEPEQIPASIRALHGRKIAIRGFMVPYRNDGDQVSEFILLRNQGLCCFGIVPRMNEWIHVRMAPGESAPYAIDVPITVFGKLEVGEVYENKALMSVYRMESTCVIAPPVYR